MKDGKAKTGPIYELAGDGNAPLRGFTERVMAFADNLNELADKKNLVNRYRDIKVGALVLAGRSDFSAREIVRSEWLDDQRLFEARAIGYSAYRAYMTNEEYGISGDVFQHYLNTKPQNLINDVNDWLERTGQLSGVTQQGTTEQGAA